VTASAFQKDIPFDILMLRIPCSYLQIDVIDRIKEVDGLVEAAFAWSGSTHPAGASTTNPIRRAKRLPMLTTAADVILCEKAASTHEKRCSRP
jgi:hypothetical protein